MDFAIFAEHADQRLDADHLLGGDVDFGLEGAAEAAIVDGQSQALFGQRAGRIQRSAIARS